MSRYIRQPGQSTFNEVDIDEPIKSEWEVVYDCYNWTEQYTTNVPRFEVDTSEYSALKFAISGYCAPGSCYPVWSTNNSGAFYAMKYYGMCYTNPPLDCVTGCGRIFNPPTGVNTVICNVTPGQSLELEIYPGMPNSIGWRGDVMMPQSCTYCDMGSRGVSCQSWDSIEYVEICVKGVSGLRPTSNNSNWHVYGKRRR